MVSGIDKHIHVLWGQNLVRKTKAKPDPHQTRKDKKTERDIIQPLI